MTPNNGTFPWFFFWKLARLQALVIGAGWVVFALWRNDLALTVLPWAITAFALFLLGIARLSREMRPVLARVGAIVRAELPYDQQLNLYYQKDEWAQIEAALADADRRLRAQLRTIGEENRKFTTLLDSIPNEILAVDRHLNVLFLNPRFTHTFLAGKEKLQQGGKIWSVLESPEAVTLFENVLRDSRSERLPSFAHQLQGENRFYKLTVSPLLGDDGSTQGAVGVFTDITEAKRIDQMRVDFVANVSHEIRTPLTSIKGFTQILKTNQAKLPTEMHGFLDKILHNTERMIALFNDILGLSVIEAKDKLHVDDVRITDILDHVEAGIRATNRSKGMQLERDLQVETIEADPKLIEQVFANLIENACKYAGESPRVVVSTRKLDDRIVIRIADNGPGIEKEHLGRIFERFYRIDSHRNRDAGGTGLGLAIVKHIVAKHHGSIRAESEGGKGTAFIIELPCL